MYCLFLGVMRVNVDSVVEAFNLFVWSQVSSVYMLSCRYAVAVCGSGGCEKTVVCLHMGGYLCLGVWVGGVAH